MPRFAASVTVLCLALLMAVGAVAAEPDKLSAAEVEALTKKAKTMVATKNVVQAIAIYEEIYNATADPKYLYNIGYLHEDTGQLDMAWDYYQRFLLAWPDAPNAAELQTYLGELAGSLSENYVLVHVFTQPAGASVEIVTEEATRSPSGVTPMSAWMPFGEVLVRLSREGHQVLEETITVKAGKSRRLRLALEPLPQPGTLTLGPMADGARLTVDGKVATGAELSLPPGEHTLALTLPDGTKRTATVTVADGTVSPVPEDFWGVPDAAPASDAKTSTDGVADLSAVASDADWPVPMATWITGATSVAATIAGTTVLIMAHGEADEAQRAHTAWSEPYVAAGNQWTQESARLYDVWKGQDDEAQMLQTVSVVLFSVAGAAAVTSLVWWLVDTPPDAGASEALVTPILLDDGLGAAATWSF